MRTQRGRNADAARTQHQCHLDCEETKKAPAPQQRPGAREHLQRRCAVETLPISIPDAIISPSTQQRIEELVNQGAIYEQASRSPNTLRSYRSDWKQFATWAKGLGIVLDADPDNLAEPISPDLVYLYVIDSATTRKPPTLARHLSAIRHWHHRKDLPSPTDHPRVMTTLAGIRRTHSYRRQQAQPLYLEDLRTAISLLPNTTKAARDRAALLVGWWGAFRRSELVGLNVSNLEDHPEGLLVTLARSKTDQESEGREVALHYHRDDVCPVLVTTLIETPQTCSLKFPTS